MTRQARPVQLPLVLASSGGPLRHRVADAVIGLLRSGHLRPGDTLPATRALAAELAISRTAVLAAYDELAAAGFVHAVGGSSTVVSPGADLAARAGVSSHVAPPQAAPSAPRTGPAGPRWDLLPGYPDTGLIAPDHWRAAWRAAARLPAPSGRPFEDSNGQLRQALAVHLRRTRGVAVDPADIVLVPGVCAGLRALTAAAGLAGRPVAFEQPGYPEGRSALASAGALIRPVTVGDAGLDPADLAAGDVAVYTTPAHQFPLGARLSAARRAPWSPTCRPAPTRHPCSSALRRQAWPWTYWASSAWRRWTAGRWSAGTHCCPRPRPQPWPPPSPRRWLSCRAHLEPAAARKTRQDQEAAASVPRAAYLPSTAAMKPSGSTRLMVSELTLVLRNRVLDCRGV